VFVGAPIRFGRAVFDARQFPDPLKFEVGGDDADISRGRR
jgi:hypothetical protein